MRSSVDGNPCSSGLTDPIRVDLGIVLRHLALAEGIVESVVDKLRGDAEARGVVTVDCDGELGSTVEEVRRGVRKLRKRLHLGEHLARPVRKLLDIDVLQGVLVLTARQASANRDVLRNLHEDRSKNVSNAR
jgi:hypothetical protein